MFIKATSTFIIESELQGVPHKCEVSEVDACSAIRKFEAEHAGHIIIGFCEKPSNVLGQTVYVNYFDNL